MSGGGVGATVKSCGGMRAPPMSPTNAQPGRLVQVADVVGGVAGRVLDPERALDVALAAESTRRFASGTGTISPHSCLQALVAAVQAPGAGHQPRRVDHVRRAALVHVDRQGRPAAHQRPGHARVVEVDVGEQQRARLGAVQRRQQRLLGHARARIDQHAVDLPAADHLLAPLVQHVDRPHADAG